MGLAQLRPDDDNLPPNVFATPPAQIAAPPMGQSMPNVFSESSAPAAGPSVFGKIAHGLSQAGSALVGQPPRPGILTSTPDSARDQVLDHHLQRLQQNYWKDANPWGSANNHPGVFGKIAHGLALAGNIAGDIVAPNLMAAIPQTQLGRQAQERSDEGGVQSAQAADEAEAGAESKQQLQESQANAADAKAAADQPSPLTQQQAEAIHKPELAGVAMKPTDYERLASTSMRTTTQKDIAAGHDTTQAGIAEGKNQTALEINGQKVTASKEIADAHNKTQQLVQQMRSSTSRANNENTVAHKGTTGAGGFKVSADITKRAALADNVNENADAAEQIVARRPDIVGAAGGRYTGVQQMIGSNDPDIQALGIRMHNIALASNGAHGLRSAEAIKQTEDELFNHFKAGPQGIKGGLDATRDSVQTFLNDEYNMQTTGMRKPTGGGSGAPKTPVKKFNPATGRLE